MGLQEYRRTAISGRTTGVVSRRSARRRIPNRRAAPLPPPAGTPGLQNWPRPAPSLPAGGGGVVVNGHAVKLTHLDKPYWPKEGYAKGDLIAYYRSVASLMLPYLRGRPQSLRRHPDGIEGEGFFQKDVRHRLPPWVRTTDIRSEDGQKIRYVVCQNEETLLYLANLGCIEINPWNSRIGRLDRPDYLAIDLDPEGIAFEKVVEVALETRRVLEEAEAPSFCRTSGGRGLHVFAPLGARYTHEQARTFAEIVANLVHRRLPAFTSLARSPSKRRNKVYLDFLQNRMAQTLVAPYSVRPRPGATVSTPLRWSEVRPGLDPKAFTIRTIGKRLETVGDLWTGVLGPGIDMLRGLKRLEAARFNAPLRGFHRPSRQ